eukprot:3025905-Pleurochrysis_carterae.AAC.1
MDSCLQNALFQARAQILHISTCGRQHTWRWKILSLFSRAHHNPARLMRTAASRAAAAVSLGRSLGTG